MKKSGKQYLRFGLFCLDSFLPYAFASLDINRQVSVGRLQVSNVKYDLIELSTCILDKRDL